MVISAMTSSAHHSAAATAALLKRFTNTLIYYLTTEKIDDVALFENQVIILLVLRFAMLLGLARLLAQRGRLLGPRKERLYIILISFQAHQAILCNLQRTAYVMESMAYMTGQVGAISVDFIFLYKLF